jgi:hypothetical protein
MPNLTDKMEPHPLLVQLDGHWDKPFAKLPKKLHGPVKKVFEVAQWDRLDKGLRRLAVSKLTDGFLVLRPSGSVDVIGVNQLTLGESETVDWKESTYLDKYMAQDSIDLTVFLVLTGCKVNEYGRFIGLAHDFMGEADCVYAASIDTHTLSLLNEDDEPFIREFLKLRLALPCKPIELVAFVYATGGAFTLPIGYAERVRSSASSAGGLGQTAHAAFASNEKATKPWLAADHRDPAPKQPWYIPARYFARQLATAESTLLTKKHTLADKVSMSLAAVGIFKRGGKKRFSPDTVLKAFSKVLLD